MMKFIFSFFLILLNLQHIFASTEQEKSYSLKFDNLNQNELVELLSQTKSPNDRFHLYKKLFAFQLQSYRKQRGDIKALATALRIATTDADKRQDYINKFNKEEKEIFTSYEAMFNLANKQNLNTMNGNSTFHLLFEFDVDAVIYADSFELYYLQILELEKALQFQVFEPEFLIRYQTAALTEILWCLHKEVTAMQIRRLIKNPNDLTLEHKELKFFWLKAVKLCYELLEKLDSQWGECGYNRLKILNLIFGERASFFFPYLEKVENPIDLFFPYVLKHADLQLVKERFDQINKDLSSWDLNFEWVAFHIKAAKYLLDSDPEKAKTYFEKAKTLIDKTLWCYSFSFNKTNWNEKREQALQLIEEHRHIFGDFE